VTFRDSRASAGAVVAAVSFAYSTPRGAELTEHSMAGPALEGKAVPPESIVAVEVAERVPGEQLRYRMAGAVAKPV
jgi:hypothetical protein